MRADRAFPGSALSTAQSSPAADLNILALVKGQDRYVFLFSDAERGAVCRTFGRFAGDPDLNFTWYDAAVLAQRVRGGGFVPLAFGDPELFGARDQRCE